jgi:hypothetical protein
VILLCQLGAAVLLGCASVDAARDRLWRLAALSALYTLWVALGCPAPPL